MLTASDIRLLTEIGFMALSAGAIPYAETIFRGVSAARPEGEAGPLGLAMVHMARNELKEAEDILRALPPSDAALTYLGLCMARRGDVSAASRALKNVIRTAPDTPFATIAAAAIADFSL